MLCDLSQVTSPLWTWSLTLIRRGWTRDSPGRLPLHRGKRSGVRGSLGRCLSLCQVSEACCALRDQGVAGAGVRMLGHTALWPLLLGLADASCQLGILSLFLCERDLRTSQGLN